MDIAPSVTFIEENGSDLEIARMRHILYGAEPHPDVIQTFIRLQNSDGGFPFGLIEGNLSTVDNTLDALWQMDELGILNSPSAFKALGFLLAVQKADGGWDEEPVITQYDLPPWISPGSLKTRLYLSAYAAYWLALKGYEAYTSFQKVLEFLLRYQDETGKFFGYLHTTWLAASAFLMAGKKYTRISENALQFLMGRSLSDWVDSQIAWALDCLGNAGLSKDHPFVERGLSELIRRQEPQGSWSSEDGESHAVGATIGALKVFQRFDHGS